MASEPRKLTSPSKGVNVHVSEPIIELAEQRNSNHCMIADAIRAARPDVKTISVDMATIRFTDPVKRQRYVYLTPQRAQLALIMFDQGEHAKPFSFRLVRPVQVVPMSEKKVQPDGTTKRTSEKTQGILQVSGGTARPVKLGGRLPPKDELNVGGGGKTNGNITAAQKRAVAAKEAQEATATLPQKSRKRGGNATPHEVPKTRAVTKAQAEKAAADRAAGLPATDYSNITMTNRRHVREFGLKQLKR